MLSETEPELCEGEVESKHVETKMIISKTLRDASTPFVPQLRDSLRSA